MTYPRRSPRNRRSGLTPGSVVADAAGAAISLRPLGAIALGLAGFVVFYWALPAFFEYIAGTVQASPAFAKFLDGVLFKRFTRPCQLAGTAILLVCFGVALWKALTRRAVSVKHAGDAGWLAKLLARHLD